MCPCPPSSSHAPLRQTPFTGPDIPSAASPPSSSAAVPFCVSPTDTVFSPVPSLSSPGVSDSNSLGPQSPVTPPLPIPAHAVFIASPDPWQFPMHLPTPALVMLDSPGILPNLPPGLPMYVLCGTPYTASDSSISAAIPVQPTAPATPQTSPLNVAPTTGPLRKPRRTRTSTTSSAGQTPKRLYECPECGVMIKNRHSNLRQHMQEQHDPNFERSQCPLCPCKYKRPGDLKNHILQKH
ncbi:hypothetical protein L227DRAFT_652599 [Lentinus tigrinus ALCF2SS1-6]|uniref:C2H2-type domain-containing protein n=1 Tax=Lentinus tigrinus ALCF2SS1-6 TaxID=1328759 RepID=A0A5C2SC33_9APHY|nr:hypothetical protein L227DRAFT_652599 [Lentinus tigrinus ALCF2SS1-6]